MQVHKFILKTANSLLNLVILIALGIAALYSVYSLWDNNQVYAAAENVQQDMLQYKPQIEETEESGPSFDDLLAINPDVCGWVVLDNTKIDYPILQGETNLTYVNLDVYGNFALAGSIFLDNRNDRMFGDAYSLLYGHHMANSKMFGDLALYKEEDFFEANRSGMLMTMDGVYDLEIYACLLISAYEKKIFTPNQYGQSNLNTLHDFTEQNAMYVDKEILTELRQSEGEQILALSTCSYEFEDARTIVLAVMRPHNQSKAERE